MREKFTSLSPVLLVLALAGCQFQPERVTFKGHSSSSVSERENLLFSRKADHIILPISREPRRGGPLSDLMNPWGDPATWRTSESVRSRFGINIHYAGGEWGNRNVDRAREAGFNWVRVDVNWFEAQPVENGNYHLGRYRWAESGISDGILYANCIKNGVTLSVCKKAKVFATLAYAPDWAVADRERCRQTAAAKCQASGIDPSFCQADDRMKFCMPKLDAWEQVVENAARTFRGQVDAWGLWNEPSTIHFVGTDAEFDQVLIRGCRAVKRGNPDAKCVGPSADIHELDYITKRLSAAKAAGVHIDVIDVHGYESALKTFQAARSLKENLKKRGFTQPIWLTETNYTIGREVDDRPGRNYEKMEHDVAKKILMTRHSQNALDKIFFYELEDQLYDFGFTSGQPELKRRPAFNAAKRLLMNGNYGFCPTGQCTGIDGTCCARACTFDENARFDDYSCAEKVVRKPKRRKPLPVGTRPNNPRKRPLPL